MASGKKLRGPAHSAGPRSAPARKQRWHAPWLVWLTAVIAVLGCTAVLYPSAASWVSDLNQSQLVGRYGDDVQHANPEPAEQIRQAHVYNDELSAGAVVPADEHVSHGEGTMTGSTYRYSDVLRTGSGVMARLQIPSIDVDLPVYHGTSDETLLKGAGHLEGTSLPVGGESTHSALTAHRGLADATMFTDLNKVKTGDLFTISVFGEVLSYQVISTQVVDPEDTATLRQEAGRDLVTLVTCTPLGINSHRILVTGERVLPTPQHQIDAANGQPLTVHFPWWLVIYAAAIILTAAFVWWAGRPPRRAPATGE